MKTIARIALAAVLGLAGATAAFAQAGTAAREQNAVAKLEQRFGAADANHDGKLTKEEADGKMPRVHQHFDEIDVNRTGALSLADIEAYLRSAAANRKRGAAQ